MMNILENINLVKNLEPVSIFGKMVERFMKENFKMIRSKNKLIQAWDWSNDIKTKGSESIME